MALVETLVEQIENETLRKALAREVAQLKKRLAWGLVFEQHIPETTLLLNAPIRAGTFVWERRTAKPRRLRVEEVQGDQLVVVNQPNGMLGMGVLETIARADVLIERTLGEPIYPALRSVESVRRGPADRPAHVVINGENYHALELLTLTHSGKVDVCYLDPPFNTGARDWRYNNNYVDNGDSYRHSKWLSMMEKRLRLCRRLLKPDGVLVIAIDEHEVHHLGMLIEQMFPEARSQMVTIVSNPKGVAQGALARVEEYAFLCFFGAMLAPSRPDDLLSPETEADAVEGNPPRWYSLLRSGTNARRVDRPRLFYPALIDPERKAVIGAGEPMLEGVPDREALVDGNVVAWPIRSDGSLGNWMVGPASLRALIAKGYVALGDHDARRGSWSIRYLGKKHQAQLASGVLEVVGHDPVRNAVDVRFAGFGAKIIKTVWHRTRHDAGVGGSDVLTALLGRVGSFPFAKSLHAMRDLLDILTRENREAVVVDPFAGSGTTLHALMLLNAADNGRRQCVLVTNNEVADDTARRLHRDRLFRGDAEFERQGIFQAVTVPRVRSAITGKRSDDSPVPGTYLDGVALSAGFAESAEFFELDYLDPLEVELGQRFAELVPTLWLAAGGRGERNGVERGAFAVPEGVPYAFLFEASGVRELVTYLDQRPDVATVFIQAATDEAYADLREQLPERVNTIKLYGSYVDHFRRAVR